MTGPLEVDTKVANASLGVVTAAALTLELASQDASILELQTSQADASALTAVGRPLSLRWRQPFWTQSRHVF